MYACHHGLTDVIGLLLEKGARVDARDPDGKTALRHAVEKRNTDAIGQLIRAGANVNSKDRDNETPLSYALKKKVLADYIAFTKELQAGTRKDDFVVKGPAAYTKWMEKSLNKMINDWGTLFSKQELVNWNETVDVLLKHNAKLD